MILENHDMLPKINATRSKLKKPINHQLIAPIIAIVRARQSNALFLIFLPPSKDINPCMKKERLIFNRKSKKTAITITM